MRIDTHELAWAAGFFDGEGYIGSKAVRGRNITLSLAQTSPTVLERFRDAVGVPVAIYGPYQSRTPNSNPYWLLTTQRFEYAQHIVAVLWKWLSEQKRGDAVLAMRHATRPKLKPGASSKDSCIRGHDWNDVYVRPDGGGRQCRTCNRLRGQKSE